MDSGHPRRGCTCERCERVRAYHREYCRAQRQADPERVRAYYLERYYANPNAREAARLRMRARRGAMEEPEYAALLTRNRAAARSKAQERDDRIVARLTLGNFPL